MTAILIIILVFGLIILLSLAAIVFIYNDLVKLKNRLKNAFSQIDVQLKRRYELIPGLVEVAKGYMAHEKETLEAVIQARSRAASMIKEVDTPGKSMMVLANAENLLSGALDKLFALVENYPDLKANESMRNLSEELVSTENRIAFARQAFNDSVMVFNTGCENFPAVLFAKYFGFETAEMLELTTPEERSVPKLNL